MKDNKDYGPADLGEQISDTLDKITNSLESMDLEGLSENIRDSVDFIREEAQKGYQNFRVSASKESMKYSKYYNTPYERYKASRQNGQQGNAARKIGSPSPNEKKGNLPVIRRIPGKVSGPVSIGFGAAGLGLFGSISLIGAIMALAGSGVGAGLLASCLPFALAGGGLLGFGIFSKNRADRISKYNKLLFGKTYLMLDELAKKTDVKSKQLLKDIKYIIDQKLAPNLTMDEKETCLLLTDEARSQYNQAEEARIQRELEELHRREVEEEKERKKQNATKEEREWYQFEEEYKAFYDDLQEIKKEMDTPVMVEHIDKVDLLLSQIYVCVREHKDMIYSTGHLTSYYLPCMNKLFRTYLDLENQPIQGDNIVKTKNEIESSFNTIEDALTEMYDEMFQDVSMDISSDIQVLKAIMSQDGLGDNILL